MKRFISFLLALLFVMTCYSQDIITFENGQSIKVKVTEVSDTQIKYLMSDYLDGPIYVKSLSDLYSITYGNGQTLVITKTEVPFYNPNQQNDYELERRLHRLNVWCKICDIYGCLNILAGTICLVANSNAKDGPYDDTDYGTLAAIGLAEGLTSVIVGGCLQGRQKRLMREYYYIGSIPILQKNFEFSNCTISSSINLMSYRNNPADGIGAGLSIAF